MSNKLNELFQELRDVALGSRGVIDIVVPPLLFLVLVTWVDFTAAIWGSLSLAVLLLVRRLVLRQPVTSAILGIVGVLLCLKQNQLRTDSY